MMNCDEKALIVCCIRRDSVAAVPAILLFVLMLRRNETSRMGGLASSFMPLSDRYPQRRQSAPNENNDLYV